MSIVSANASIISDYNKVTAANDGWTAVYSGGYGTSFNYAAVLNGIAPGSQVALASSSSTGSTTFDLFAATTLDVLQTITATNQTIFADGTYWYRNGSSTGFTPNANISQSSADTIGIFSSSADSDLRLSWHGGATTAYGGWRSGNNAYLNADNTWQRYVLVRSVPEPMTAALLGLGLLAAGIARRRTR
ncbi:MAG: PEP-CTERM sorting domain-containing protein [Pseudomonadota bacterium]